MAQRATQSQKSWRGLTKIFGVASSAAKPRSSGPLTALTSTPFWTYAMVHLRRRKLATINKLKETVKDVARTVLEHTIRDVVAKIRKRCKACVLADGDRFKYFLKHV